MKTKQTFSAGATLSNFFYEDGDPDGQSLYNKSNYGHRKELTRMEQRRRRLKRTIDYRGRDWFRQYEQLAYSRPHHVLLESGQGGRYSMIGLDPIGVIRADERRLIIKQRGVETVLDGSPLEGLRQWLRCFAVPDEGESLPCQGG
ncbi:Para-aminobenzoate synthetase component I [Geobacillus sp. WSUCF1]|nr:Para-aminobenzoate synthetase component I [Geobacillus sp. WSUCF1]